MMKIFIFIAIIVATVDCFATDMQRLLASDGAAHNRFRTSVSISENSVVIGSDYNDESGNKIGHTYIFTRDEDIWTEQTELSALSDKNNHFGCSVSMSSNHVITGDYGSKDGAAYIFEKN